MSPRLKLAGLQLVLSRSLKASADRWKTAAMTGDVSRLIRSDSIRSPPWCSKNGEERRVERTACVVASAIDHLCTATENRHRVAFGVRDGDVPVGGAATNVGRHGRSHDALTAIGGPQELN